MKSAQVPLAFEHRPALGREDFIVAPNNAKAVALIDRWPDWPTPVVVVTGKPGTGKSHLAEVFRAKSSAARARPDMLTIEAVPGLAGAQALVLDAMDVPFDERALFHLLNLLRAHGGFLLITARTPPARWTLTLPDLASRLGEALVVELGAPDDSFLTALLIKLFADHQLQASPALVNFLVNRLERSCAAMVDAVAALDAASLSTHRPVSVALAREILQSSEPGEGAENDGL